MDKTLLDKITIKLKELAVEYDRHAKMYHRQAMFWLFMVAILIAAMVYITIYPIIVCGL